MAETNFDLVELELQKNLTFSSFPTAPIPLSALGKTLNRDKKKKGQAFLKDKKSPEFESNKYWIKSLLV